jgi:hypothetical protein
MRRGWRLLSLSLIVGLAVLSGANAAHGDQTAVGAVTGSASVAKSAVASGTEAPLTTGHYGVQVGPDEGQGVLVVIVGITLDVSVKLPARVRIPVPPGSSVAWAGEVLGNNPAADKQREYTLGRGDGGAQYAEFTLAESHQGQIDVLANTLTTNGSLISATTTFVQSVSSTSTAFAVRMPAGVDNVKITPTPISPPEFNSAGESLYTLGERVLAPGAKLPITLSYSKVTTQTAPSGSTSPMTMLFVVVAGALLVVIVAILVIARRGQPSEVDEESDEDAGDDEVDYEDEGGDAEDVEDVEDADEDEGEAGDGADDDAFDFDDDEEPAK